MLLKNQRRTVWFSLVAIALAGSVWADNQRAAMGYDDLIARLGENAPTGAGIIAGQNEAPSAGNYGPDTTLNVFLGKNFTFRSGSTGVSGHATTVGRHYYSNNISLAPGITEIHCWEVNNWLGSSFLRLGFGNTPPLQVEVDVFNNSWIGNAGSSNREILRRVDFAINDQQIIFSVGVNNNSGPLDLNDTLLSHSYNAISVGNSNGSHHSGNSLGNVDGPGRMIPVIVAPDNRTSWNTALISSMSAALFETSRTWDGLADNPNADRVEVVKASILAGAFHRNGWSNNPDDAGANRGFTATPLDPVFGVDQANINISHMILTGLEQDGFTQVPSSSNAASTGWDLADIASDENKYYRFEICDAKELFSVILTWNRSIAPDFQSWQLPDLNLQLYAIDGSGNLVPLIGDNGLGVFESGNVVSQSAVDNVEHLYLINLVAGSYVLEVSRTSDALGLWEAAVAWFMPPDLSVASTLTNLAVTNGTLLDGDLSSLSSSDDVYVHTRSGFGSTLVDLHNMEMTIDANTSVGTPVDMCVSVEARIDQPVGNAQVKLRNINSGVLETIGSYTINETDNTKTFHNIDPANYIDGNGDMQVAIKHAVFVPFFAFTFESFVDQVQIRVR